MVDTLSTTPQTFWRRLLPHVFALAFGVGAFWLTRGLEPVQRDQARFVHYAGSFALIAAPLLGVTIGAVLTGAAVRSKLYVVSRPYVRATVWMWALLAFLIGVIAYVDEEGFIPTDAAPDQRRAQVWEVSTAIRATAQPNRLLGTVGVCCLR